MLHMLYNINPFPSAMISFFFSFEPYFPIIETPKAAFQRTLSKASVGSLNLCPHHAELGLVVQLSQFSPSRYPQASAMVQPLLVASDVILFNHVYLFLFLIDSFYVFVALRLVDSKYTFDKSMF
ncbi:hypothetical protein XELAEV_18044161mg [Xenopus laevis]|uniref:Uncharacterized protein n=1 Tax=Xenopus laevis TaxID=8355 RepID=A0A974BYI6_XENLA|nr:hypothetical protein XELAEV_18044161mg [Xenopus laevis]